MRTTSPCRGFTLIEALIASVLLAACVVGIGGVLSSVSQNAGSSDAKLLAAERSRFHMELLASKRLSDYSSPLGPATTETIPPEEFQNPDDSARTTGEIRYIARTPLQTPRDLALVSVTTTTPAGETVTLYRIVTRAEMLR